MRRAVTAVRTLLGATLGRALVLLLTGFVRLYQLTISPLLGPTCRFHPSCSAYALRALRQHGAVKGTALSGWRLLRCNPWNLGGLDPVPEPGHWRAPVNPDGTPRGAPAAPDPVIRTA